VVRDNIVIEVRPGTGSVVVLLDGVLSMQTVVATGAALTRLLADWERVVVDLSRVELRQPGCVAVFGAAMQRAGGWPNAKLALFGADPRMLTHLARSSGPAVPRVADSRDAALVMADQPPGPAGSPLVHPAAEPSPYHFRAFAKTNPEAVQFIQDWLGVLIEHDVREHSELVATLAGFLEHNQDYDTTAGALDIHRSTARYRIHRVAQVTQLDLRDPETVRSLRVAIQMFNRLTDVR
jgi:hypothetical protein